MTGLGKRIKLRATLMIDLEASDYLEAAKLQKEMEDLRDKLNDQYGPAEYDLRERRDRGSPEPEPTKPRRQRKPKTKVTGEAG